MFHFLKEISIFLSEFQYKFLFEHKESVSSVASHEKIALISVRAIAPLHLTSHTKTIPPDRYSPLA